MVTLKIADIRIDGGTQSRVEIDTDVMSEYADAIRAGAKMPPVTVFFDGADHWLADGFHRLLARLDLSENPAEEEIDTEIIAGSQRDAILYAVGANASHGMRRSNDDKHRAVGILLADREWSKWSDREIARRCFVSHPLVASIRSSLEELPVTLEDSGPEQRTYITKHGTEAVMNTVNIGRSEVTEESVIKLQKGDESVIGLQNVHGKWAHLKSDFTRTPEDAASVMKSQPAVALTIRDQQRAATVEQREILEGSAPVAAKPSSRVDAVEDSSSEENSEQADLDAYVASLQRTVEALRRENASLAATDRDGEIQKLSQQVLHLENRVVDLSEKNGAQRRQLDWFGAKFNDLRKLTGAKMDRDVVGLVHKLVEAGE